MGQRVDGTTGNGSTESGSVAGSGAQPLLDNHNNNHDKKHNHNNQQQQLAFRVSVAGSYVAKNYNISECEPVLSFSAPTSARPIQEK